MMLENNKDKNPTTVVIKVKNVGKPTSFIINGNILVFSVPLESSSKYLEKK